MRLPTTAPMVSAVPVVNLSTHQLRQLMVNLQAQVLFEAVHRI
jgi:hypothetical protein